MCTNYIAPEIICTLYCTGDNMCNISMTKICVGPTIAKELICALNCSEDNLIIIVHCTGDIFALLPWI